MKKTIAKEVIESPFFGSLQVVDTMRKCEEIDIGYRGILDDGTVVLMRAAKPLWRLPYTVRIRKDGSAGAIILKWKRCKAA